MRKNQTDVNRFWTCFRDTVLKNNVPESQADWYVKWAQKYAFSVKGKPLRERTAEDVRNFLLKLEFQKGINSWQIEQAQKSIYLLYYKYLKFPLNFRQIRKEPLRDKNQSMAIDNEAGNDDFKLKSDVAIGVGPQQLIDI